MKKLQLEEENLRLSNHINDLNKNSKTVEMNLKRKCDEYAQRARIAENEVNFNNTKDWALVQEHVVFWK